MPKSINGFGTSYHGGAAPIRWGKPGGVTAPADHDAVECAIALGLPVFPFEAYHTYNWRHTSCQAVRIRRTPALVLRALFRPYLLALTWPAGVIFFGMLAMIAILPPVLGKPLAPKPGFWAFFAGTGLTFAWGAALLYLFRTLFARSRDIRLVLGPHEWGSSDPALWTTPPSKDLLEAHGVEAARKALLDGQFSRAMFAARLLLASGDAQGKSLTEEVLRHRRVREVLPRLRRRPWLREELLPEDKSVRVRFEDVGKYISAESLNQSIDARSIR